MQQVEHDYSSLGDYVFEFNYQRYLIHKREYDPLLEALNKNLMFSLKKLWKVIMAHWLLLILEKENPINKIA